MRIAKLGVVGAGTMGSGIAALAASAGIPVVLLDIPGPDGDRSAPARAGLERARKARPAAFMDVDRAGLVSLGNLDDSLDVVGVHGIGGLWGALATGIFCVAAFGGADGLTNGGGLDQLWRQAVGVAVVAPYSTAGWRTEVGGIPACCRRSTRSPS